MISLLERELQRYPGQSNQGRGEGPEEKVTIKLPRKFEPAGRPCLVVVVTWRAQTRKNENDDRGHIDKSLWLLLYEKSKNIVSPITTVELSRST